MTLAITANILFAAIILAVIVGMLAWAIHSARPERPVRTATGRVATGRAATGRAAHAVAREHGARPRLAREYGAHPRPAGPFARSEA